MPQLDKITFLSQFFWLSFFYLGFYFLIYKYFLPKMSRILKFRKRRINTSQNNVIDMGEESQKVAHGYQALLSTGFSTCKSVFNQNFKGAEDWLNKTTSVANQTKLKNTNTIYISSLGQRSISQRLTILQAFAKVAEKSLLALLVSKFKSLQTQDISTIVHVEHTAQPLKGNKVKKTIPKQTEGSTARSPNIVVEKEEKIQEKQENQTKNKNKQNKDVEQTVDKSVSSKDKNYKTVSPKSSTTKDNKNKNSKKK